MRNILCVTLIALLGGCTSTSVTEKYQDKRNDIINVKDKVCLNFSLLSIVEYIIALISDINKSTGCI